jgi:hypothetical protein
MEPCRPRRRSEGHNRIYHDVDRAKANRCLCIHYLGFAVPDKAKRCRLKDRAEFLITNAHPKNEKVPISLVGVKGDERGEMPFSASAATRSFITVVIAFDSWGRRDTAGVIGGVS